MTSAERGGVRLAWKVVPLAWIAVLGIAAYSNTFDAAFVFDDRPSIVDYEPIRNLSTFLSNGERPNRFVGYLTFALNYRFGGLDPAGYHAVNLAIHLANAILVFFLVTLVFRTPILRESNVAPLAGAIASVAAMLFVAHPLQTGAVTYVVQRLTSLATTFYLAAIVQYVSWRLCPAGRRRWLGLLRYALLLGTTLLAMRTKEISFTLPLAIVLAERLLFGPVRKERWLALAPLIATIFVIPLTTAGVIGGSDNGLLSRLDSASRAHTTITRWEYATTQLAVVATYLRMLVLPVGQTLDHDFPLYTSLLAPRVLLSAAVLTTLAAAALALAGRRSSDRAARLVSFGVAWFFLGLAVESSVLPIADVLMEHRVYLPSVGIFVSVATASMWLAHRRWPAHGPRAVVAIGAMVAVVLSVATFQRNEVWSNEVTLWSDVVAKSPRKARGYNSLGAALNDARRHDEAIQALATAIRLDPAEPLPYYNLGRVYLLQGSYERAVPFFAKALELRSDWAEPYANIAGALNRLGRYYDTIQVLSGAGEVVRDSAEATFNLGVAYAATGRRDAAEVQLHNLRRVSSPLAGQLAAFMNR